VIRQTYPPGRFGTTTEASEPRAVEIRWTFDGGSGPTGGELASAAPQRAQAATAAASRARTPGVLVEIADRMCRERRLRPALRDQEADEQPDDEHTRA